MLYFLEKAGKIAQRWGLSPQTPVGLRRPVGLWRLGSGAPRPPRCYSQSTWVLRL